MHGITFCNALLCIYFSGALIILTKRVVEHQDVDWNGMVVVRARRDGGVWIEPGSKLLRADDKVTVYARSTWRQ